MTGRFVRVEGRPEEAAVLELRLDPGDKERARQVIEERAVEVNRFLAEQVDLLKVAADAVAAGDREAVRRASRAMFERFPGSKQRDPLFEPLLEVLPRDAAEELRTMVDEYWSAWIAAEARTERGRRAGDAEGGGDEGDGGEPDRMMEPGEGAVLGDAERSRVQERLVEQLFSEEIRRAYDRVIQPYRQKIERVYEVTGASPEQREAIRAALVEYIREGRLRPTEEQRRRLVERIYGVLDEEQRLKLFEAALAQL